LVFVSAPTKRWVRPCLLVWSILLPYTSVVVILLCSWNKSTIRVSNTCVVWEIFVLIWLFTFITFIHQKRYNVSQRLKQCIGTYYMCVVGRVALFIMTSWLSASPWSEHRLTVNCRSRVASLYRRVVCSVNTLLQCHTLSPSCVNVLLLWQ